MTPELLSCPACDRVTALKTAVRPNEKLRCPHCGGEFSYSELSHEMLDCWEVLEEQQELQSGVGSKTIDQTAELAGSRTVNLIDPSAQTLVDLLGEYEGLELETPADTPHSLELPPTQVGSDEARELSASPHDDSSRDFSKPAAGEASEPADSAKNAEWSGFQPLTPELYERRRRKSRSPLWSVVQVALGGLAAIPIALLLVWHVIGTDVADAGPWVGRYLPMIVPDRFRPAAQSTAFPEESGRAGNELSSEPLMGNSSLNDANTARTSPGQEEGASADNSQREQASNGGFPLNGTTDQPTGAGRLPDSPILESDEATRSAFAPTTAELNAPLLENTFALIRQASEHLDDWSEAARKKDMDLRSLAQATYRDLTNLALVIDKLPPEDQVRRTVRRQLQSLGRQVVADTEVQRLMVEGARYWVGTQTLRTTHNQNETQGEPSVDSNSAESQDSRYGLAMIVVVEAAKEVVSADGQWWNVVANPVSRLGEPPLEIRIPQDVAMSLASREIVPQQSLFLLGGVSSLAEESDSQADSAPHRPVFVASYAVGL